MIHQWMINGVIYVLRQHQTLYDLIKIVADNRDIHFLFGSGTRLDPKVFQVENSGMKYFAYQMVGESC